MDEHDPLAERFEAHRPHLQAVAYRMLGSASEAEDAVQEAWFRYHRADTSGVENLTGWLTTVVSRVCLDMLRSRSSRREAPLEVEPTDPSEPEREAELADSVGVALLVLLDRLSPAERVAFVLQDLFAVPFDQIAPIVDRTPVAAKKLASRARQRVRGAEAPPDPDLVRHRRVVEAFLAAARAGDLDGLLAVLAPDVVRRADRVAVPAGVPTELRGAREVAEETRGNAPRARFAGAAMVDGTAGLVVAPHGHLAVALRLTIEGDAITEIDAIADPARLARLAIAGLDG